MGNTVISPQVTFGVEVCILLRSWSLLIITRKLGNLVVSPSVTFGVEVHTLLVQYSSLCLKLIYDSEF